MMSLYKGVAEVGIYEMLPVSVREVINKVDSNWFFPASFCYSEVPSSLVFISCRHAGKSPHMWGCCPERCTVRKLVL